MHAARGGMCKSWHVPAWGASGVATSSPLDRAAAVTGTASAKDETAFAKGISQLPTRGPLHVLTQLTLERQRERLEFSARQLQTGLHTIV